MKRYFLHVVVAVALTISSISLFSEPQQVSAAKMDTSSYSVSGPSYSDLPDQH